MTEQYQVRVMDELKELTDRRARLALFLTGKIFETLPADEQRRLRRQYDVMGDYADVLTLRIANFRET